MNEKRKDKKLTKYGFSFDHDAILDLCRAKFPICPFGCAKDGAPNCYSNAIIRMECPPAKAKQEMQQGK